MEVMLTRTRLTLAGIAAAAVLVTGCSTNDNTAAAPPSSRSTSTTSETSAAAANTTTTDACRSLADDQNLKKFWADLANQGATTGAQGMLAGMAVMRLGKYTPDPDLDPAVADAMESAVTAVGDMNVERAAGAEFDVERFRDAITPVVAACQDAGVDMAVE
ncbi:MAG: hypothetical protein WBA97_34980 [Actinophytocola sp.]|uniref:hypothetical protein n=1 Tax=Actinophytocola sp. TaxID=1872138 RepID=UPI003C71AC19